MKLRHGQGALHDPDTGPAPTWGGRKAQQYVRLTLEAYGSVCWLCGLGGANTADHVIPRSEGGAVYELENLAPAHRKTATTPGCNESRGNRAAQSPLLVIESNLDWYQVREKAAA